MLYGTDHLCQSSIECKHNEKQQSTRQLQSSRRETNPIGTKGFTKVSGAAKNLHTATILQTEAQTKLKELATNKQNNEIIK